MFYFKRKSGPRSRAIFTNSWTLAFDARSANRWHSAARTLHSIADIILANGRFPEDAEIGPKHHARRFQCRRLEIEFLWIRPQWGQSTFSVDFQLSRKPFASVSMLVGACHCVSGQKKLSRAIVRSP